jgi:hypothetical protein
MYKEWDHVPPPAIEGTFGKSSLLDSLVPTTKNQYLSLYEAKRYRDI